MSDKTLYTPPEWRETIELIKGMTKTVVLPKKETVCYGAKEDDWKELYYLSYSQISKWKKNRREYIRKYFFGEDTDSEGLKKYSEFGKKIGEALEKNDFSVFEPDEQKFLKKLPRYDKFELRVNLFMDGFFIQGYVDTAKLPDDHVSGTIVSHIPKIADYKTGDIAKREDEYADDEYIQLDVYAAGLKQMFGKYPEQMSVFLIGRDGNAFKGEELTLTKEFVTIDKEVDEEKIKQLIKDIQETAEEISTYYQAFLKLNSIKTKL